MFVDAFYKVRCYANVKCTVFSACKNVNVILHRLVCGSPIEALGDDKKPGSPIEALGDDKKRKGSRSQGFKGSSGSLGIFFESIIPLFSKDLISAFIILSTSDNLSRASIAFPGVI